MMAKSLMASPSFTVTADCECREPENAARRRQTVGGLRCDVRFVVQYGSMFSAPCILFPHCKASRVSLTRFGLRYIFVQQANNGTGARARMAIKLPLRILAHLDLSHRECPMPYSSRRIMAACSSP